MADGKTKLAVIDGETLMDMKLPPTKFCVDTLLPQGLCILGGASKIGKSWWVLDLCVRIAKGEPMWDLKTTSGTTLYLCLEDKFYSRITSKHQRNESGDRILFAAEKGCGRGQRPPTGERCKLQRRKCFHGIYGDQDRTSQKGRNEFLSLCAVLFAERKRDRRAGARNRFGVCEKGVAGT